MNVPWVCKPEKSDEVEISYTVKMAPREDSEEN